VPEASAQLLRSITWPPSFAEQGHHRSLHPVHASRLHDDSAVHGRMAPTWASAFLGRTTPVSVFGKAPSGTPSA